MFCGLHIAEGIAYIDGVEEVVSCDDSLNILSLGEACSAWMLIIGEVFVRL